ncbi:MAG: OsmC family protein [Methylocystis sp.]|nr:OsmC family protein [Methylocystis sp.]
MDAEALRAIQAPIKERYRAEPGAAMITLSAQGRVGHEGIACRVETAREIVEAGFHPATGGDGLQACSGNMLLEALVACAGVTLTAVATALDINLRGGTVTAEGDLDFRGALGVAKDVPVGFRAIRVRFDLDADASPEKISALIKLTERYCVVYQTLRSGPSLSIEVKAG